MNDNEYLILYEKPSFYGNLKVIGYKPKNSEEETHYILYQNGFTQNTVAKNGEWPGCKHHDSQYGLSRIFRLAMPPSMICPCVNPDGCGVVSAEFLVQAARVAIGDISLR